LPHRRRRGSCRECPGCERRAARDERRDADGGRAAGAPAENAAAVALVADPTVDPGADPVNTSLATYVVPEAPAPQVLAQVDLRADDDRLSR
jgi:hypothetical protein